MLSNVYVLEVVLILFFAILFVAAKVKNGGKYFLVCAMFMCFTVLAFRGESVGTDTTTYMRYFSIIDSLSWKDAISSAWSGSYYSLEVGYTLLEKIIGIFCDNPQWIIIACAAIYIINMYHFINNACVDKATAVFTFLAIGSYLPSFNTMRQGVAVSLCCLAWVMMQQKKEKKALMLIVLAASFHLTALIFLGMFIIRKIPTTKKIFATISGVVLLFAIAGKNLVYFVLQFFPTYEARYGKGRWEISKANGIVVVWTMVALIIVIVLFTTRWEEERNHVKFEVLIYCLLYIGVNIMGQEFDGFQRLEMYFQPFLLILFDEGKRRFDSFTQKIYSTGVVVSMVCLFLKSASTTQYIYKFFWEK